MKTGEGEMDTSALEQSAIELFLPVMESATVLAAHYSQACGRDCVVAKDMRYGMMYAARNVAGRHVGSLYPEVYEDSGTESEGEALSDEDEDYEEDEEGEEEEEEEDDPEWTEYEGTEDDMATKMNECARTWADWVPANPTEAALKSAVDSIGGE
jgi:hypothetical protein